MPGSAASIGSAKEPAVPRSRTGRLRGVRAWSVLGVFLGRMADVAVGDSALSQIDNPASLSLSPRDGCRLDLSGQFIFADVHWSGPVDSADSEIRMIPLANLGVALPVNPRWTWGLALHSKCGLASRFHNRHLLIPFMDRRTGSDAKNLSFLINAAYKATDKLSLGVGLRAEVVTAEFSAVLGPADVDFGRGYAHGGGFQVGLRYQAREDLAFGVGYRSPSWFGDLSGGDVKASLFGLLPIGLGHGNIDTVRLPQQVTVGAAWDATDWCKLVGEVRWLNYSDSVWNDLTVATDGMVDLRVPLPLGYRDQWAFIAGTEFKLDRHWTLGVGYNYGRTPTTARHLFPVATVLAEHHASVGLRYTRDDWWIGAGYILGFRNSMRGAGASSIPFGIDYGVSDIEQTQHSLFVGFGFGW
jgi:long-subunit fatty acid transport protein